MCRVQFVFEVCEILGEPQAAQGAAAIGEGLISDMGLLRSLKHPGKLIKVDFWYFLPLSSVHTMRRPFPSSPRPKGEAKMQEQVDC